MNYTEIGVYLVGLLLAIAEVFLLPWLKTKVDANKLKQIMEYVRLAVEAAEKLLNGAGGEAKKAYVENYLMNKGINIDTDTLDNMIEASVLEMEKNLLNEE